jgi:hypothetical protein
MYQLAVTSALSGSPKIKLWAKSSFRAPHLFRYPVLFLSAADQTCGGARSMKHEHAYDLAKLNLRLPGKPQLPDKQISDALEDDHSLTDDQMFFIMESHSVCIYHRVTSSPGETHPEDEYSALSRVVSYYRRSALIESLLIQRWSLYVATAIARRVAQITGELDRTRRYCLLALDEYQRNTFAYGTANDIVRRSRERLGIDQLHDELRAKLDGIEALVKDREARLFRDRNQFLKLATLVVNLLFGPGAADQFATLIHTIFNLDPTERSTLVQFVLESRLTELVAETEPVIIAAVLYSAAVAVVLIAIIRSLRPIGSWYPAIQFDQSRSRSFSGFVWPFRQQPKTHDDQAARHSGVESRNQSAE